MVSSPIRSISAHGPIGWFSPRLIATSMSFSQAIPSNSAKQASLSIGIKMRLTMKPGMSRETTVVLPSRSASARVIS